MAQAEVPEAEGEVKPKAKPSYRGSALSYGHQASVYTFARAAEPTYNPTYVQSLELRPEWHFNDQLFARAKLVLSQELTLSDETTYRHEVELSDLALDAAYSGWTERNSKLLLAGDFRISFPTSKTSRGATRVLAIGPALSLSRTFGLRSGLTLKYSGRYSYRFHRFTTGQNSSPSIAACGNPLASECAEFLTTGRRNAHSDLTHGPAVSFAPFEKLSVDVAFQLSHLFLYPLSANPAGLEPVVTGPDTPVRNFTSFDVSVTWQVFKPVGITFGASTFRSPQLSADGTRYFPLFNRNTTLYLDAAFDLEAAVTGIFGEST